MVKLRSYLSRYASLDISRMADEAVIHATADLMASGRLHFHTKPARSASAGISAVTSASDSVSTVPSGRAVRAAAAGGSVSEGFWDRPFPLSERRSREASRLFRSGTANFVSGEQKQAQELFWIEIELIGEDDQPIPGEEYLIVFAGGRRVRGYLDEKGFARIDFIESSGKCKVSFPALDRDAVEFVEALSERGHR
jgi:hypothetical protein